MTAFRFVLAAFVGLSTVAAYAQIPPPAPGATDPTNNSPQTPPAGTPDPTPKRGTRDASQGTGARNNQMGGTNTDANGNPTKGTKGKDENGLNPLQGPDIVDDPNATPEQKASAEYSGPAVLSRGISASEPMNPKNIRFTPSVGLEYILNSGLTGVAVQSDGSFSNKLSSGVSLTYGLIGEKVLKRDTFSLGFNGNLTHYAQQSGYDGTSNQLALTWRHRLSKHFTFGIRESAQEYNNNNLLLSGAQLINSGAGTTLVTASPLTEAFDGRVLTFFHEGDVTWQLNSRLSINLLGAGFSTRRASTSLYGNTGYQAGADVAYRLTRRVTAGIYYQYTHFDFIGLYGGSDINTVGLTYSIAFNPNTELVTRVGGSRLETTGLQGIQLDPFLAALFGTTGTVEAVYLRNYVPDFNVQIRRKVSDVNLSVAYTRGVTPGNGIILTSIRESVTAGANYRAGRKWNFGSTAGYDTLSSFGASDQKYASVFVGSSVYRNIAKNLDWHSRLDFHHYTFDNTGFLRNSFVFSTGIVWSPGDILERLW